jgi:hypothetical protein
MSRFKRALELAIRFVKDCRAERGCNVATGHGVRMIPGPNDQPHDRTFLLTRPKTILGCHPRLLSKLLS